MSQVKVQGNALGTGIFTIASPNSNNTRTMTLADTDGTIYIAPGNGIQTLVSGVPTARTITAGTGISVSNGDGSGGNPTITNSGVTSVNGQTGAVTISSGAPAAYDVGAYIVGHKNSAGSSATTAGETQSGSVLRFSTNNGFDQPITAGGSGTNHRTPGLSGTWRAMQSVGSGQQIDGNSGNFFNTLWCRVS